MGKKGWLPGLIFGALLALGGCATVQQGEATPPPAHQQIALEKPIVLLIGIDGLRWDAIDRNPAPTLRAWAKHGVRAQGLISVMPSVTFVNFYSIATGLYANHTGVVSNLAYSRKMKRLMERETHGEGVWWGGEPIWVTAEKQGVTTAAMFWLGSEAKIAGRRPTFWYPYQHHKPKSERVRQILDWLAMPEATRPHLLTLYFSDVDTAEHRFGPQSPEEAAAILDVDANLADLKAGIAKLGLQSRVNIIVVSDHGMTKVKDRPLIYLDDYINMDEVMVPKFISAHGPSAGPFVHIFVNNKANIDHIYQQLALADPNLRVYRRGQLPRRWHLNNADRTGDIFAVAEPGYLVFAHGLHSKYSGLPKGMHGYDRHGHDMYGSFIADGPAFRRGLTAEPFDNVNVYGLIARILHIKPAKNDGNLDAVKYILKDSGKP